MRLLHKHLILLTGYAPDIPDMDVIGYDPGILKNKRLPARQACFHFKRHGKATG